MSRWSIKNLKLKYISLLFPCFFCPSFGFFILLQSILKALNGFALFFYSLCFYDRRWIFFSLLCIYCLHLILLMAWRFEIKLVCLLYFEVALYCKFTEIFRSFSFALSIYFSNEVSWTINNSCFMYSFLLPFSKIYGLVKRNRLRCSIVWMISNGKKYLSAPLQVQPFLILALCTSNV